MSPDFFHRVHGSRSDANAPDNGWLTPDWTDPRYVNSVTSSSEWPQTGRQGVEGFTASTADKTSLVPDLYTIHFVVRFGDMDTSVGRSTEARGLPHAFPVYDPWDTLAWLCQKHRSCRPDWPSLCSGCHRREMKLIVRPCGETRWPHASSPRIITGRSSKNRLPFWSWLAATGGRLRHSWIQQIGDGTPFSIRAEWSKARRRGHTGLTQRTSAVYAIWWWWWWW